PRQRTQEGVERLFLIRSEQRDVLEPGQVKAQRSRDRYRLQEKRDEWSITVCGERDFLDNILRGCRRGGNHQEKDFASFDRRNDFLSPLTGRIDALLVHPDGHPGRLQPLDPGQDAISILPGVTDEDICWHGPFQTTTPPRRAAL